MICVWLRSNQQLRSSDEASFHELRKDTILCMPVPSWAFYLEKLKANIITTAQIVVIYCLIYVQLKGLTMSRLQNQPISTWFLCSKRASVNGTKCSAWKDRYAWCTLKIGITIPLREWEANYYTQSSTIGLRPTRWLKVRPWLSLGRTKTLGHQASIMLRWNSQEMVGKFHQMESMNRVGFDSQMKVWSN